MFQILVVEDDIELGEMLSKALVKKGYRVLFAADGQEGMHMCENNAVDLVITDIIMPEKDGIELIVDLKRYFPHVKIIAISGGGRCGSGQEYLYSTRVICNVEHTLAKPFRKDQLFSMVQNVLKE